MQILILDSRYLSRVRRFPHVATAKMGPVETDMHGREDGDRE